MRAININSKFENYLFNKPRVKLGKFCVFSRSLDIHDEELHNLYTLRAGNAFHHSVQNLSSSRLLHKNVKIKIYKTVILSVVLYGCETRFLTLMQ
jgi:hypothetical protein